MGRGGKGPKRKGDLVERAIVQDQEGMGRVAFRVRQGGGESVDIVSIDEYETCFIQVKATKPYLAPAEREALIKKADAVGAIPAVAWISENKEIEYRILE